MAAQNVERNVFIYAPPRNGWAPRRAPTATINLPGQNDLGKASEAQPIACGWRQPHGKKLGKGALGARRMELANRLGDPLPGRFPTRLRVRRPQAPRVVVPRLVEDLRGWAALHDLPAPHHDRLLRQLSDHAQALAHA